MEKKMSFSVSYIVMAFSVVLLIQYWLAPRVVNVSYTQFKNNVIEKKINSVVVSVTC